MAQEKKGNTVVKIESPFPLADEAIIHIKKVIGNGDAPHEVTINTNLLAGFKARCKGILYDGSAERIIRQLTH
jgi:F0F1-type ATP synthase delta subunit